MAFISEYQYDAERLQPTSSTFKDRVFHCHYVTIVLHQANLAECFSSSYYGWEFNDSFFVPILTDKLPAPLELIELSVCTCKSDFK